MILKLAWRNLWRNKRRTFITTASVLFAVLLSALLMALKEGKYTEMVEAVAGSYTGYGQVHAPGFWAERTPDYSFRPDKALASKIGSVAGISGIVARVDGVALVLSDDMSKVGLVIGIDVEKEARLNRLDERVSGGAYLEPDDRSVIVGAGLAEYLNVGVGDTLVLLGQGYHGAMAAGKYNVKGLVKFGSPELSKQVVLLPLKEAQWFFSLEDMISSYVLFFDEPSHAERAITSLRKVLGDNHEVMTWNEMMPDVSNLIETDRAEGYVFMFILYMVVTFGIFGTILMMLAERKHEFGVLVAVGMNRSKLGAVVWSEVVIISLLGALAGIAVAYPVCYYFHFYPIRLGAELQKISEEYGMEAVLRSSIDPSVFIQQGAVVLAISLVIALYPFFKLVSLKAVTAMKN